MSHAQFLNALPNGYRLQEYELVRVLGAGGFGLTYLGFDDHLDKAVAIKEYMPTDLAVRQDGTTVLPKAELDKPDFEWGLREFLNEAKTLARFDHPNIVKVYRFFEAHGTAYIVMEYIEGPTLSEVIKTQGSLEGKVVENILFPIMDGLKLIHQAGFLHRDIKPANIILRKGDEPVLIDFGAARQAIGAKSRSVTAIVTPGYAPVEQYSSRGNLGAWTDIYALGAVGYTCISGERPIDAMDRIRRDPLVPAAEVLTDSASRPITYAIDCALEVDEHDRPQTIELWLESFAEGASPHRPKSRKKASVELEKTVPLRRNNSGNTGQNHSSQNNGDNYSKSPVSWFGRVMAMMFLAAMVGGFYWYFVRVPDYQLYVSTQPDDAVVTIIDTPAAYVMGVSLPANLYRVQVSAPGFKQQMEFVDLQHGDVHVSVNLQSLSRTLVITTKPDNAKILVNGSALSAVRNGLELPAKAHQIEVSAPGFESVSRSVDLSLQDQQLSITLIAREFQLSVATTPNNATVKLPDITPSYRSGMALPAGRYRVVVSMPGYQSQTQWVDLTTANGSLSVNLSKNALMAGDSFRVPLSVGGNGPQMVVVPSGNFRMGDIQGAGDSDEAPVHQVSIGNKFAVSSYEVTVAEFSRFVQNTNHRTSGEVRGSDDDCAWRAPGFSQADNQPVVCITYPDAIAYTQWLSQQTGKNYRLLSESEWEYSARAGSTSKYSWGNSLGDNKANCDGCGSVWDDSRSSPVGSFSPNRFGLFDMHGNVREWVQDCWHSNYDGAPSTERAWTAGSSCDRVVRGGSWYHREKRVRAAYRIWYTEQDNNHYIGFRVAQDL